MKPAKDHPSVEHGEVEISTDDARPEGGSDESAIDISGAIRAAKSAVAQGRGAPPAATAKMEPFDLAIALAKVRADERDDTDEVRRSGERLAATRAAQPTTPAFEITPEDIERIASEFAALDPQATGPPTGEDPVKAPEGRLAVVERPVAEDHVLNATNAEAPSSSERALAAANVQATTPEPLKELTPQPTPVAVLNGAVKGSPDVDDEVASDVAGVADAETDEPKDTQGSGNSAKYKSAKSGVPKFDPSKRDDRSDSAPAAKNDSSIPPGEESTPEVSDPSPLVASIRNPPSRGVSRSSVVVYLIIVLVLAAAFAGAALMRR